MPRRQLNFPTLSIRRIISHLVLEKDYEAGCSTVEYTEETIEINDEMKAALLRRLEGVMGRRKSGFYLDILHVGGDTFFQHGINAMQSTEEVFIKESKEIANLLAESQRRKNIPKSYLFVIDAYDSTQANEPVLIVVKAEPHEAFRRTETGMELVKDLFLSPAQALYKVGVLYKDPKPSSEVSYPNDIYSAFVYDQQAENGGELSKYFYERFLGLRTDRNSALLCRMFYEKVAEFIKLNIKVGSRKAKMHQALRHEFAKQAPVIKPAQFTEENFEEGELKVLFINTVVRKLPDVISKDLTLVEKLLKNISYKIGGVRISADNSDYADSVTIIESAEQLSELKIGGNSTIIVVKGKVQNAE
ncbi:nucleoid-associated protein [Hymenobacter cheonanensis]|uniref:nucleoid-associated protein n=1 Tax=Hymenobacter sp. CA2-7 TaxID=3063993 RepID=UPI00271263D6|nr:nucleoid-associated protein [Hymenobacter sp. CA2-7]MDO7888252.1 nucleoid-associated protein [Hymenobacter sp. CA2-7]